MAAHAPGAAVGVRPGRQHVLHDGAKSAYVRAYRRRGTTPRGRRLHAATGVTSHADRSHRSRIVGTGRISDLRHRVPGQPAGADRGALRCGQGARGGAGGDLGPRRRRHRRRHRRPARPPGRGSCRDPAPPSPASRSGTEVRRRRQDRLAPEADVHLTRGGRPPGRRRGSLGPPVQGVRELPVLPPRRPGAGADRRGRDRHAALHPHQEQPGAERDRLGRAGKRHRLAAAARAVRRRAAGVRRRPPQVRPRLALHGRAGGGPRLHRAHRNGGPPGAAGRALDRVVPLSRQPHRQPGDRPFAGARDRNPALCPGRPCGDHRQQGSDLGERRPRAPGRRAAARVVPGRRPHRVPRRGDRLGAELRAVHTPLSGGRVAGRASGADRARGPAGTALRARRPGVRPPGQAGAGRCRGGPCA